MAVSLACCRSGRRTKLASVHNVSQEAAFPAFGLRSGGDPVCNWSASDSDRTASGACRYCRDDISGSLWSWQTDHWVRVAVGHRADRRAVSLVIADRPGEGWPSSN